MPSLRQTLLSAVLTAAPALPAQRPVSIDWKPIETVLGRAAVPQPNGIMRFNFPRTDLDVRVGDVRLRPALALGGWVAFLPQGDRAIAMGDLVLTVPEVSLVARALMKGGVDVTAEHNHLLGEEPRVMYLHIMATGSPAAIAQALRDALALSGTPLSMGPPSPVPLAFPLDTAALARALGAPGKVNGGVYQTSLARPDAVSVGGVTLPPAMGLATAINVQPVDSATAVATGDFVLTPGQLTPVVRALDAHGVTVTAVHSHLMGSTPELLFVHFWVKDTGARIAEALGAAVKAE